MTQTTDAGVASKVPRWLLEAPAQTRLQLKQKGVQHWAWADQPQSAALLTKAYAFHRANEARLAPILAQLPSAEAFAEPLLKAAILERFGIEVDVRKAHLFHAGKVRLTHWYITTHDEAPKLLKERKQAATHSLLAVALQNFEAWEAEPGGMDFDRQKGAIYAENPFADTNSSNTVLNIAPHAFAALCRELDLGEQYKALIESVLRPQGAAHEPKGVAAANRRGLFLMVEHSALQVQAHLAYLNQAIDARMRDVALNLAHNRSAKLDGANVTCSFLKLWDIELTGVVIISKDRNTSTGIDPVMVYMPDDPIAPLKQYASSMHFINDLRERMQQPDYRRAFERYIPARHRNTLLEKLLKTLYPFRNNRFQLGVWNPDARLRVDERRLQQPLLAALFDQKATALKDDGLFHAVPTAEEDHKSFQDKLAYLASAAFTVLNIAGFVVPGLGEVMMAVTAGQLLYETVEGIDSLAEGEREQAWGYLTDVVENVALMAALGTAGSAVGAATAVEAPELIGQMREVQLPDGDTRLWKPDLGPYDHDIVLPAGLQPDAQGLYPYKDKLWLPVDDRTFAVRPAENGSPYRLEHPTRANAYQPPLRHNGAGAWLHEMDEPLSWEGLKLFRRLGFSRELFNDDIARQILHASATEESVMRQALAELEAPPGPLADTARRFRIDRQVTEQLAETEPDASAERYGQLFRKRYEADGRSDRPEAAALQRDFSSLPRPVVEELLAHANEAELSQLRDKQRVPLRLAEEAHAFQRQIRLNRAYEGLYLNAISSADTDRLALHTLETLPGWSGEVRIEVRDGHANGALIDSIGPSDAAQRKVLIKDGEHYLAQDADGNDLHGRDNLYAAILHALPDPQRNALGVPDIWQTDALKRLLQASPLPRERLREVLQMAPADPAFKSPMRLADGRVGYPLSGRGTLPESVSRASLLDRIRLLGFEHDAAEGLLQRLSTRFGHAEIDRRLDQLVEERQLLQSSLSGWPSELATDIPMNETRRVARQRLEQALWQHWRATCLPELGQTPVVLTLESLEPLDFPHQLPGFIGQRTRALALQNVYNHGHSPLRPELTTRAQELVLRHFPEVTWLEAASYGDHTSWFQGLPEQIARLMPQIETLSLRRVPLGSPQTFRDMPHLNSLTLATDSLSLEAFDFRGLNLDYLGLERLDLMRWPATLNAEALTSIRELDLTRNRINWLPEFLLEIPHDAHQGAHTLIRLQGNPLLTHMVVRARIAEWTGSRYQFGLDIRESTRVTLDEIQVRREAMLGALDRWLSSDLEAAPSRFRTARTISRYWHETADGVVRPQLELDEEAAIHFPHDLPESFYSRVEYLSIPVTPATVGPLEQLLPLFTRVVDLHVRSTLPFEQLPEAVQTSPTVVTLDLRNSGQTVGQAAIDAIGRLPALNHVILDGNFLGDITDPSILTRQTDTILEMNNMGLQSWPEWLEREDLEAFSTVSLRDNQMSELPQWLLDNPRNPDSVTYVYLTGNPLSQDAMTQAHLSNGRNRAFVFEMDLPDDIRELQRERHESDTSPSEDSQEDSDAENEALENSVEYWVDGGAPSDERDALWQRLAHQEQARNLLQLIGRLRRTAEYRNNTTRSGLIERVWQVLRAADADAELLGTLNGMSEEPLTQFQEHHTCADGLRLEFNQMEIQVFTREALGNVSTENRGQNLYRLTQRLYRLNELDRLARERSGPRDEAEVRLAYRLHAAQRLDLPLAPQQMLFEAAAALSPGELEQVLNQVQAGESGQPFLDYAIQRDFWEAYLREVHADRFRTLKEAFENAVLDMPDQYPDDYPERIAALEAQYKVDEQLLLRQLTQEEANKV